ncbi:MAG: GntR family transcriptional regulator, partial [Rhodospirillales bacterium]
MPDDNGLPLQTRIRQMIVTAILDGQLAPGATLPSCRKLAKTVGVARNTVVLAYEGLVDEGFLNARERSGFFVSTDVIDGRLKALRGEMPALSDASQQNRIDWSRRLRSPARDAVIVRKPADWQNFPFPFISGQLDPGLFPLAEWRECSRQAMGRVAVRDWANDARIEDDPDLIEQVRTRILPRRGVRASESEVLITVGAQHALWLIASLLATPRSL